MAQGRHIRRRRFGAFAIVAIGAGAFLLIAGGAAFAAYRYERANEDRILPGVRIAGVDVSGMTRDEAIDAVTRTAQRRWLSRSLAVSVAGERWGTVTPASLGQSPRVALAVDRAFQAGNDLGTFSRFWHRFRDEPVQVGVH